MPEQPTPDQFLDWFGDHSAALAEHGRNLDGDAKVPSCPGWTMQDLLQHTGHVYEMAATSLSAADPEMGRPPIEPRPEDVPVSEWFAAKADQLQTAFGLCGPDTPVWTFLGPKPASFWFRRMANETAVHHWDAAGIENADYSLDPNHAVAMIDEYLDLFLPRLASQFGDDSERSIHLHATDTEGEWVLQRSPNGVVVSRAHAKSTTALRGPAAALALFVWSRSRDNIEIFGDSSQVADWHSSLVI
ncbi:MAG: maleylpyruvate isomerase family mycothiol-dependent enzyme [Actinobacteria bacterium]|nr:maleylpyruvate isomerase family mycothiol-dependent enzyme [Actinomycetota bacterium]